MKAVIFIFFIALAIGNLALAQTEDDNGRGETPANRTNSVSNPDGSVTSPVRGIERDSNRSERGDRRAGGGRGDFDLRSVDGTDNNLANAEMGAAETALARRVPNGYADGVSELAGEERPSARVISNIVHAQIESDPNEFGHSDFLWQWGQFIDHDIDLTDGADPVEPAPISVPSGDPFFDPDGTGTEVISLNRSIYAEGTGTDTDNPREQLNEITAWIDASNVYGSDEIRADALRTNSGGRLRMSAGDLLPFNDAGLANAGGSSDALFLAGDVRANEQLGLAVMHTLFVREHNRIADRLVAEDSGLDDETVYQRARREIAALMQIITYREFLPALLGENALEPYRGYDDSVDAGIRNAFSAAAYRLGHTMLSPVLLRLDADGSESEFGHLSLADAFFSPTRVTDEGGIEPVLRGLAFQVCQSVDVFIVDEVRNFLFGLPGSGGFDLASLNIQRGRDHGLGNYNAARIAYGLPRVTRFEQVISDPEVRARMRRAYQTPQDMDIWTAGLAEDPVEGGLLGPLFRAIVIEQFTALRDGDRFWYQRSIDERTLDRLEQTTLADIIRRNTSIDGEISDNVFVVGSGEL